MASISIVDIPESVNAKIGVPLWRQRGNSPVELSLVQSCCAAVKNRCTLFWHEDESQAITGKKIAPPSMLSVWGRPLPWRPGNEMGSWALQSHFYLKDELSLPEAVIVENELCLGQAVCIGEQVELCEIIRSVGELKTTRLGTGRFWVIDVEYKNADGDYLGTESYTAFGYVKSQCKT